MPLKLSPYQEQLAGHLIVGAGFAAFAYSLRQNPFILAATLGYGVLLADSFLRPHTSGERLINFRVGCAVVLLPAFALPLACRLESSLCSTTIDGFLRATDMRLGFRDFALSRYCFAHHWAFWATVVVYDALPLVMVLAWIVGRSKAMLWASLWGAAFALPCYLILPAVGPEYAFSGWPSAHSTLVGSIGPEIPRNCVPSMHAVWSILAAWGVRGAPRVPFAVYALLMAAATVACGEHYIVDVLAAAPFSVILWCSFRPPERVTPWVDRFRAL